MSSELSESTVEPLGWSAEDVLLCSAADRKRPVGSGGPLAVGSGTLFFLGESRFFLSLMAESDATLDSFDGAFRLRGIGSANGNTEDLSSDNGESAMLFSLILSLIGAVPEGRLGSASLLSQESIVTVWRLAGGGKFLLFFLLDLAASEGSPEGS